MRSAHGAHTAVGLGQSKKEKMSKRFPHYRPSTALRQAIEALNLARKNREVASERHPAQLPGQGQGGPDASHTPGRESANAEPARGQRGPIGERPKGNGALTSGRDFSELDDDA